MGKSLSKDSKLQITISTLVTIVAIVVTGVTYWNTYSFRIINIEAKNKFQDSRIKANEEKLAKIDTMATSISNIENALIPR